MGDAKKLHQICVLNGSVHETVLLNQNFINLHKNNSYEGCIKMLALGRVDATPVATNSILSLVRYAGLKADIFQQTPVMIHKSEGFLALSKNTPDKTIQEWQSALDQTKKSGKYQQLHEQFIKPEGK